MQQMTGDSNKSYQKPCHVDDYKTMQNDRALIVLMILWCPANSDGASYQIARLYIYILYDNVKFNI